MNAYLYLESENIFEEDNMIDHSCLFKDISKHKPRQICYDIKNDIDYLKFSNL